MASLWEDALSLPPLSEPRKLEKKLHSLAKPQILTTNPTPNCKPNTHHQHPKTVSAYFSLQKMQRKIAYQQVALKMLMHTAVKTSKFTQKLLHVKPHTNKYALKMPIRGAIKPFNLYKITQIPRKSLKFSRNNI